MATEGLEEEHVPAFFDKPYGAKRQGLPAREAVEGGAPSGSCRVATEGLEEEHVPAFF